MRFTCDWTGPLAASLDALFPDGRATLRCLEIGSFDGLGSLKIAERLCRHADAKLFCVDPWQDVYLPGQKTEYDQHFVGQFVRFLVNTERESKIVPLRGTLLDFSDQLSEEPLDFVYCDADHTETAVYADAMLAWTLLRPGGIILFDDHTPEWGVFEAVKRFRQDVQAAEIWKSATQIAFAKAG